MKQSEINNAVHELAMRKGYSNVTFADGANWAEKKVIDKACKLMAQELGQIQELLDCDLGKWHRVGEFRKAMENKDND